jgi:hypothetical protein
MVSASRFITESGTGVKWGALGSVVVGAIVLAITEAGLAVYQSWLELNLWALRAITAGINALLTTLLTESAAIQGTAWQTASSSLEGFGVLAPWIAVANVLVVVGILSAARRTV